MESLAVYDSSTKSSSGSSIDSEDGIEDSKPDIKRPLDAASSIQSHSKRQKKGIHESLPSLAPLLAGASDQSLPDKDFFQRHKPLVSASTIDSSKHEHRIRTFPHVEGAYATSVFIPVILPSCIGSKLEWITEKLRKSMPGIQPIKDNLFGSGKKGVCNRGIGDESQALHVSLSRIVSIRFPEIDMLIGTLKRNLSKLKHKQISVKFGTLRSFVNDDGTRSFLALAENGTDNQNDPIQNRGTLMRVDAAVLAVCSHNAKITMKMHQMVKAVNRSFVPYGLKTFYKEPNLHASFAWILGDERPALDQAIQGLNEPDFLDISISVEVASVNCRIGQKVYQVWGGG